MPVSKTTVLGNSLQPVSTLKDLSANWKDTESWNCLVNLVGTVRNYHPSRTNKPDVDEAVNPTPGRYQNFWSWNWVLQRLICSDCSYADCWKIQLYLAKRLTIVRPTGNWFCLSPCCSAQRGCSNNTSWSDPGEMIYQKYKEVKKVQNLQNLPWNKFQLHHQLLIRIRFKGNHTRTITWKTSQGPSEARNIKLQSNQNCQNF